MSDFLDKPLDELTKERRQQAIAKRKANVAEKKKKQQQKKKSQQQQRNNNNANRGGKSTRGGARTGNRGGKSKSTGPIRREHKYPRQEPYKTSRADTAERWTHDKFDKNNQNASSSATHKKSRRRGSQGQVPASRVELQKSNLSVRRVGEPTGKVFFNNVKTDIVSDELRELFSNYGPVLELSLRYDRNGKSVGEGFVVFPTADIAKAAVKDLHMAEVEDQTIHLKLDITAKPNHPAPQPRSAPSQRGSGNKKTRGGARKPAGGPKFTVRIDGAAAKQIGMTSKSGARGSGKRGGKNINRTKVGQIPKGNWRGGKKK